MRKFLHLFCVFWLALIFMIGCIRIVWILLKPVVVERNVLDRTIHTIVLGPSNGEFAWNDEIILGSKNLCASATSFGGAFNNLRWATEYNENKPDTVILCASFVSLAYINDKDMPRQLNRWDEEKRNLLNYSVFFDNYCRLIDYWKYILVTFPIKNFQSYKKIEGGYLYMERDELDNPHVSDKINAVIQRAMEYDDQNIMSEEYLRENFTYQINNLRLIKEYCDAHQQTLVILSPPVYRISDMVKDEGYWRLLCSELGDSTLVANYSRFEFPDTTCFADFEHLNYKGARYFSEHIVKEGLRLQYAIEYCNN